MPVDQATIRVLSLSMLLCFGITTPFSSPPQAAEGPGAADAAAAQAELLFWESMKDSQNPDELRAYLTAYPNGRFAALARIRLSALSGTAVGAPATGEGDTTTPSPASTSRTPPERRPKPGPAPNPKAGETFRDCESCPLLVVIPPGRFEMGASNAHANEGPPHEVAIPRPFAMGIYEVTVGDWDACRSVGACPQVAAPDTAGNLPIANLSWDDVQRYLKWLSGKTGKTYRLPSEAEWEYAARAGTRTPYWWGEAKGAGKANCADCGSPWDGKGASPVGSFEPNPFGLFDVHGNVWEWTQDCWNDSYRGAPADATPWLQGDCVSRAQRGGSWALEHDYMRTSRRGRYDWDVRYHLNGFRVARDLPGIADADDPFETAVLTAADKVFSSAPEPASGIPRPVVAIDPLVDGLSGMESTATRTMASTIAGLVAEHYPQLAIRDLSASAEPFQYAVIGTFTGVNKERKPRGAREAFRICLALLDLESGTVASKTKVFAQPSGVDITPTPFFRDSPAWTADPATRAYIDSCQTTKPGGPAVPAYLEQLSAAKLIAQGIEAYEMREYRRAQDLFERASRTEGGEQMRTYNGLYLTSWKLGDHRRAAEAFANILRYGLANRRLGIKFPFVLGSTRFAFDPDDGGQYDIWLIQIAKAALAQTGCIEIAGHTPRGEADAADPALPLRRADYIKRRLEAEAPELHTRLLATGKGVEDNLVGSGTGDERDALDARIELAIVECPRSN